MLSTMENDQARSEGRQSATQKAEQMEVMKFAKERLEELLATTSWEDIGGWRRTRRHRPQEHPSWRPAKS